MIHHKKKVGKPCQISTITSIIFNAPCAAAGVLPALRARPDRRGPRVRRVRRAYRAFPGRRDPPVPPDRRGPRGRRARRAYRAFPGRRDPPALPGHRGPRGRRARRAYRVFPGRRDPPVLPGHRGPQGRRARRAYRVFPGRRDPPVPPGHRDPRGRQARRAYRVFPGRRGPTGPTGAQGAVPDDSFASFANYQMQLTPNSLIVLFPDITDSTGNIAAVDSTHIRLEPGYYLISYEVSVLFNSANYMQVTPSYNGAPASGNGYLFRNAHQRVQRLRVFLPDPLCALFNGFFPHLFRLCRRPGRPGYAYHFKAAPKLKKTPAKGRRLKASARAGRLSARAHPRETQNARLLPAPSSYGTGLIAYPVARLYQEGKKHDWQSAA